MFKKLFGRKKEEKSTWPPKHCGANSVKGKNDEGQFKSRDAKQAYDEVTINNAYNPGGGGGASS